MNSFRSIVPEDKKDDVGYFIPVKQGWQFVPSALINNYKEYVIVDNFIRFSYAKTTYLFDLNYLQELEDGFKQRNKYH